MRIAQAPLIHLVFPLRFSNLSLLYGQGCSIVIYSLVGQFALFFQVEDPSLSSDQPFTQLSLLVLLFCSLSLQAGDTFLANRQFAFKLLYNLVGLATGFTRLNNTGLCALSFGTQGLPAFIGSLELVLHLLNLLCLLLFCNVCTFPGGTQAPPLQGIPGQQDLL